MPWADIGLQGNREFTGGSPISPPYFGNVALFHTLTDIDSMVECIDMYGVWIVVTAKPTPLHEHNMYNMYNYMHWYYSIEIINEI